MTRLLSVKESLILQYILLGHPSLQMLIKDITQQSGTVYLVGGAVRDCVLLLSDVKDIDFEVHGLEQVQLYALLERYGSVNEVGKSFGVFKFRPFEGSLESDWSLPRRDSAGRKPHVTVDPYMTIDEALRRRDLTMNAMAINMATLALHDPFGGSEDIKNRILRCPDPRLFVEDPLRFYRVMQFVGRFEFNVDNELQKLCATMDVTGVARERIEEEIKKLLLKSPFPSQGFRWINSVGRMQELFPEIAALRGIVQSPQWHPEGDVFEHTMQALDAAACSLVYQYEYECDEDEDVDLEAQAQLYREYCKEKLILLYAVLCHDLGKVSTTVVHADGTITSYGHEEAGVPLAVSFLKRFCGELEIIAAVKKLVRHHMDPGNFLKNNAKISAYKKLALKLAPEANCTLLALVMNADKLGRNGASHKPLTKSVEEVHQFLAKVNEAGVGNRPEAPVIKGEDLLDSILPGPELGAAVRKAYEIQINEGIKEKEVLKKRVLGDLIKKSK